MEKYHKIQTVYNRDPSTNHKTLLVGEWAKPEFEYLRNVEWVWTEKVDGTNIRIHWDGSKIQIGGRTDNAQIPTFLYDKLFELFSPEVFADCFDVDKDSLGVTLYGEGYGVKIQKGGGNYISDGVDFVLFDVMFGQLWFERGSVEDVAQKLDIKAVPVIGRGTLLEGIGHASIGFNSAWGNFKAEGLVMRPKVELINRRGQRIITKIKAKDFQR